MATGSKDLSDQKFMTPIGIASFCHVFEPHAFEGGTPNYSLIIVFPEGTDLKDMKKACQRAALKKFGDAEKIKALASKGKFKWPWRDGSDYAEKGEPFVQGSTFVTLKSKNAPGIVDARAKPIMNQMDFYAGCQVRASVLAWAFDSMGNTGVTLLLNNLQKCGEGKKLAGGKMNAEDEFEPIKGAAATTADDDGFGEDDDSPF